MNNHIIEIAKSLGINPRHLMGRSEALQAVGLDDLEASILKHGFILVLNEQALRGTINLTVFATPDTARRALLQQIDKLPVGQTLSWEIVDLEFGHPFEKGEIL